MRIITGHIQKIKLARSLTRGGSCAHNFLLLSLPQNKYTLRVKHFSKLLVAGTFDHFHVGHQHFLHTASGMCDQLIIIIGREGTVERIKGRVPRNSEEARLERVQSENIPHAHVRLGRKDGNIWETIREEMPNAIFLGYDQQFDEVKGAKLFPDIEIMRGNAYRPEHFKSSKF
jgi:cytidyltransferase-like protein